LEQPVEARGNMPYLTKDTFLVHSYGSTSRPDSDRTRKVAGISLLYFHYANFSRKTTSQENKVKNQKEKER
jgi:hypothetical protein